MTSEEPTAPPAAVNFHRAAVAALRAGDLKRANEALTKAIGLDSKCAEFRATLGDLLQAAGRKKDSVRAYMDAVRLEPRSISARISLGHTLADIGQAEDALKILEPFKTANSPDGHACRASVLMKLERWDEALDAARAGLAIDPKNVAAVFNEGRALAGLSRFKEALSVFSGAKVLKPNEPAILYEIGNTRISMGQLEKAEEQFREVLRLVPTHRNALERLSHVLWMQDRYKDIIALLEAATTAAPQTPDLWFRRVVALKRMNRFMEAMDVLREAETRFGEHQPFDLQAADLLREEGNLEEALKRARRAHDRAPTDFTAAEPLVRVLLQSRKARDALLLCRKALDKEPFDQLWLAYLTTAVRGLGLDDVEYGRLVRSYDLEVPFGYTDLKDFNGALAKCLNGLHQTRSLPIDSSVRGGTKTLQALDAVEDPVLTAFFRAVRPLVDDYIAAMPDTEPDDPVFGRKAMTWHVENAWSVRLRTGGQHINHVHPGGWISSAYFVSPDLPEGTDGNKSGWLTFGVPPVPFPGAENPVLEIAPKPGRLVLFPSCMWHGTLPHRGPDARLTMAMDIIPI